MPHRTMKNGKKIKHKLRQKVENGEYFSQGPGDKNVSRDGGKEFPKVDRKGD